MIRLFLLGISTILVLTGCNAVKPPEMVQRHPPPDDMVRLAPLPVQTDPTMGGLLKGYANAAQQYRVCQDRHTELQEWVNSVSCH